MTDAFKSTIGFPLFHAPAIAGTGGCILDDFNRTVVGAIDGGPWNWVTDPATSYNHYVGGVDGSRCYATSTNAYVGYGWESGDMRSRVSDFMASLPFSVSGVFQTENFPDVGAANGRTGASGQAQIEVYADDPTGRYNVDLYTTIIRNGASDFPGGPGAKGFYLAVKGEVIVYDYTTLSNVLDTSVIAWANTSDPGDTVPQGGTLPTIWATSESNIAYKVEIGLGTIKVWAWEAGTAMPTTPAATGTFTMDPAIFSTLAHPMTLDFRLDCAELHSSWLDDLQICTGNANGGNEDFNRTIAPNALGWGLGPLGQWYKPSFGAGTWGVTPHDGTVITGGVNNNLAHQRIDGYSTAPWVATDGDIGSFTVQYAFKIDSAYPDPGGMSDVACNLFIGPVAIEWDYIINWYGVNAARLNVSGVNWSGVHNVQYPGGIPYDQWIVVKAEYSREDEGNYFKAKWWYEVDTEPDWQIVVDRTVQQFGYNQYGVQGDLGTLGGIMPILDSYFLTGAATVWQAKAHLKYIDFTTVNGRIDPFDRVVASGWGLGPLGQWNDYREAWATKSVDGNYARASNFIYGLIHPYLPPQIWGSDVADFAMKVRGWTATASAYFQSIIMAISNGPVNAGGGLDFFQYGSPYINVWFVNDSGGTYLSIDASDYAGNGNTVWANTPSVVIPGASTDLILKCEFSSTEIKAKWWLDGAVEPDWQITMPKPFTLSTQNWYPVLEMTQQTSTGWYIDWVSFGAPTGGVGIPVDEGWGAEFLTVQSGKFTLSALPARGSMTVFSGDDGTFYINNHDYEITTPLDGLHYHFKSGVTPPKKVVVTYLAIAPTDHYARQTVRIVDPSVGRRSRPGIKAL